MRRVFRVLIVMALVSGLAWAQGVVSPPDFPQEVQDLEALHDQGQYVKVYEEGLKRGTLWGYIIASYAATNYARYQAQDRERKAWFDRAADAARKAIALDSREPKAHFALGQALGRYVQYAGLFTQALLVNQIRASFTKAIELDPLFPDPYIGMGLWHAEGVHRNICLIFGCRRDQVQVYMRKAESLRDRSKRAILGYVDGLYANLLIRDLAEARRIADIVQTLTPRTAEDRYEMERGKGLLEELKKLEAGR
ncbi:hypothetical protein Theos_1537 [Thermus oshimai JL-2]|uniref:Tetratricopeptide repeat protein n=1 Tax=Thermus oshimai JL-2 TaxID=751945 RepID=K7QZY2_THEOS|nr:hypothetical protein [Thermus oshimai]AFV76565.1 hypothetical protein Theos_1537 [Thermus oshimai JL-2]